ncbi:HalOD1 output domain-containing protein [Natrinema sp. 1APR25-10V2]|uniref:HalOD1 output domain-containing protein n=1 Tax=Natrinema sp. 1APR25-10V2 TaxID=2951081 RepID=UPI0031F2D7CB
MQTMNTRQIDASDCPSQVVINAIAAYSNTPVLALEPLYKTINPKALDKLVKNRFDTCVVLNIKTIL